MVPLDDHDCPGARGDPVGREDLAADIADCRLGDRIDGDVQGDRSALLGQGPHRQPLRTGRGAHRLEAEGADRKVGEEEGPGGVGGLDVSAAVVEGGDLDGGAGHGLPLRIEHPPGDGAAGFHEDIDPQMLAVEGDAGGELAGLPALRRNRLQHEGTSRVVVLQHIVEMEGAAFVGLLLAENGVFRIEGEAVVVPDQLHQPHGGPGYRGAAGIAHRAVDHRRRAGGGGADREGLRRAHRLAGIIDQPLDGELALEEGADAVAKQQKGHAPAGLQGGGLDQVGVDKIVGRVLGGGGVDLLGEKNGDVAAMFVAAGAEAGNDLGGGDDLRRRIRDGQLGAGSHGAIDGAVPVVVDGESRGGAAGHQLGARPGAGSKGDTAEAPLMQGAGGVGQHDAQFEGSCSLSREVEIIALGVEPGHQGQGAAGAAGVAEQKLVAVGDLAEGVGLAQPAEALPRGVAQAHAHGRRAGDDRQMAGAIGDLPGEPGLEVQEPGVLDLLLEAGGQGLGELLALGGGAPQVVEGAVGPIGAEEVEGEVFQRLGLGIADQNTQAGFGEVVGAVGDGALVDVRHVGRQGARRRGCDAPGLAEQTDGGIDQIRRQGPGVGKDQAVGRQGNALLADAGAQIEAPLDILRLERRWRSPRRCAGRLGDIRRWPSRPAGSFRSPCRPARRRQGRPRRWPAGRGASRPGWRSPCRCW